MVKTPEDVVNGLYETMLGELKTNMLELRALEERSQVVTNKIVGCREGLALLKRYSDSIGIAIKGEGDNSGERGPVTGG